MSQTQSTTPTGDRPQTGDAEENQIAGRILLLVLAAIVVVAVLVALFGLVAATMVGLLGTLVVYGCLLAISVGK